MAAVVTAIDGLGTPETAWRAWEAPARWPELEPGSALHGAVLVAPHPDDEVLGAGGLLRLLHDGGVPLELVAVTDGEASHPESTVVTPKQLAALRRDESAAALRALEVRDATVHRLGQPDGGIDEDAVAEALVPLLAPGRWCLATWRGDGHPDHEAVGRAAASACAATGARLLEYPVWTWHWARPDDPAVPWERARRVSLPEDVLRAKHAAVREFVTQIQPLGPARADAPVLPAAILERLLRPYEVVLA